ncbi:hypothetical protein FACS18949_06250 [Clostridia bacterium]|nr:hypothetical protein FACS18949_06250 [Clostridia bacterium]
MKRAVSLVICLTILISCISVTAFAEIVGGSSTTVNGHTLTCDIWYYVADTNLEYAVWADWNGANATVTATMEGVNYYTGAALFAKTQNTQTNSTVAQAWRWPALSTLLKSRIYGRAEVSGSGYYGITPVYSVVVN